MERCSYSAATACVATTSTTFPWQTQQITAHELAHVRQQTGGAVSMLPKEEVGMEIDPDPGLEQEAEETAKRVMRGGELGVQRMADTNVHVQRSILDFGDDSDESGNVQEERVAELSRDVAYLKANAVTKDELAGSEIDHNVSQEEMMQATINQHEAAAEGKGQREDGMTGWAMDQIPDGIKEFLIESGIQLGVRGGALAVTIGAVAASGGTLALPALASSLVSTGALSAAMGAREAIESDDLSEKDIERISERVAEYQEDELGGGEDPLGGE